MHVKETAPNQGTKIRDLIVYAICGLILVGVIVFSVAAGVSDSYFRGAMVVAHSALIFGVVIRASKNLWRNRRFWLLLIVMWSVHIVGFGFWVSQVPRLRLGWLRLKHLSPI